MQAVEFSTQLNQTNNIEIPQRLIKMLKGGQMVKVIILFEDEEQKEWEQLTAQSFLNGYAEQDSMYDNL